MYPQPLLSIIIPSKGRQASVNKLLTALNEQLSVHDETVEIIIVDDGSTPALVQSLSDDLTHWFRLDKTVGAPAARRYGFAHASGRFIHFHDSDDSISPGWLMAVLDNIIKQPDLDFLVGSRTVVNENGKERRSQTFIEKNRHHPRKIAKRLSTNNCFGPLGGLTFSRAAVKRMHFNNLQSCQDWDMYLDALHEQSLIVYDDQVRFIKNETSKARISDSLRKKLLGYMQLGRVHKIATKKTPLLRLFYVYSVMHKFPMTGHGTFEKFCSRYRWRIYLSFIAVELRKLINNFI